jgi:hypothetical protein
MIIKLKLLNFNFQVYFDIITIEYSKILYTCKSLFFTSSNYLILQFD